MVTAGSSETFNYVCHYLLHYRRSNSKYPLCWKS